MQQLGRGHKRVRDEIQELTNIYVTHCRIGTAEGFLQGIAALEARWDTLRRGAKAKWTEATVVGWKASLLDKLGRFDEALALEVRALTLPKTNDETILTLVSCVSLLQKLGRADEAYGYALRALSLCQPPRDLHWVVRVVQSVIMLGNDSFFADLAARYGELVMASSHLPLMARWTGPEPDRTPLEVLHAFHDALMSEGKQPKPPAHESLRRGAGAGN